MLATRLQMITAYVFNQQRYIDLKKENSCESVTKDLPDIFLTSFVSENANKNCLTIDRTVLEEIFFFGLAVIFIVLYNRNPI